MPRMKSRGMGKSPGRVKSRPVKSSRAPKGRLNALKKSAVRTGMASRPTGGSRGTVSPRPISRGSLPTGRRMSVSERASIGPRKVRAKAGMSKAAGARKRMTSRAVPSWKKKSKKSKASIGQAMGSIGGIFR
jgi:hypothetical protein